MRFLRAGRFGSEKGQGLTEYAIVLSLVAIAAMASMALFGGAIKARVAGITGAIAGDERIADDANKKAENAAKKAQKAAKKVDGMETTADDGDGLEVLEGSMDLGGD